MSAGVDTTVIGAFQRQLSGADIVGNTTAVNCAYNVSYDWSGFFAPVDGAESGKRNGVKAGSAVPMKFRIGGNYGLAILAAGYPRSVAYNCDTSVELTESDIVTSSASSGLTYDALSGTYSYVWKTEKSWAGQCRRFTLRLNDGVDHVVDFKLMR